MTSIYKIDLKYIGKSRKWGKQKIVQCSLKAQQKICGNKLKFLEQDTILKILEIFEKY